MQSMETTERLCSLSSISLMTSLTPSGIGAAVMVMKIATGYQELTILDIRRSSYFEYTSLGRGRLS